MTGIVIPPPHYPSLRGCGRDREKLRKEEKKRRKEGEKKRREGGSNVFLPYPETSVKKER